MKKQVEKYEIVCGIGTHRTWTAALAELAMLNKYGNQPDYFWRNPVFDDEYLRLIKLCGRIAKQFSRDKLAWYIYKEPAANFDEEIGLIIWKLKGYKFNHPDFTMHELVKIYKGKFRPSLEKEEVVNPEVKTIVEKQSLSDLLGDI